MTDETPQGVEPAPPSAANRAAEELIDAATGFDRRAWITLRDLVVRPWTLLGRVIAGPDPRYVGSIKLSLVVMTISLLVTPWLMPTTSVIQMFERAGDIDAAQALRATLDGAGVDHAHFDERYTSRSNTLNTILSVVECLVLALVLSRFDRTRRFFGHLDYALYLYTLWVLVTTPLIAIGVALPAEAFAVIAMLGMLALPGLLIAGLPRFYPAPWPRQLLRGAMILLATASLLVAAFDLLISLSLRWTLASFGL